MKSAVLLIYHMFIWSETANIRNWAQLDFNRIMSGGCQIIALQHVLNSPAGAGVLVKAGQLTELPVVRYIATFHKRECECEYPREPRSLS